MAHVSVDMLNSLNLKRLEEEKRRAEEAQGTYVHDSAVVLNQHLLVENQLFIDHDYGVGEFTSTATVGDDEQWLSLDEDETELQDALRIFSKYFKPFSHQ